MRYLPWHVTLALFLTGCSTGGSRPARPIHPYIGIQSGGNYGMMFTQMFVGR